MTEKEIECPKCKKRSVYVEHPDEYEVWLKCRECDYFQGMSKADWHKIHNSPNLDAKLRKIYEKEHGVVSGSGDACRACGSHMDKGGFLGLCDKCCYKILILIVVIMVIGSYMAWMALL